MPVSIICCTFWKFTLRFWHFRNVAVVTAAVRMSKMINKFMQMSLPGVIFIFALPIFFFLRRLMLLVLGFFSSYFFKILMTGNFVYQKQRVKIPLRSWYIDGISWKCLSESSEWNSRQISADEILIQFEIIWFLNF